MTITFTPYPFLASDGRIIDYIHISTLNDGIFGDFHYVDEYYIDYDYTRNEVLTCKSNKIFKEMLKQYKIPILEK